MRLKNNHACLGLSPTPAHPLMSALPYPIHTPGHNGQDLNDFPFQNLSNHKGGA